MASRAGFLAFIRNAGFSTSIIPDNSQDIDSALALSIEIVYSGINDISPSMYDLAVYNLGTSNLIEFATDQPGKTFFADKRKEFKIDSFTPGMIASASDEGTSTSFTNPDWVQRLTIADLQYLKNPWGKQYLAIAQRMGTLWGMS